MPIKFVKVIDNYIFEAPSIKKYKKYDVYDLDTYEYLFSFGQIKKDGTPYEQYSDKIGYYKKYDHHDRVRMNNYYKRHPKNYDFETPDTFSKLFLW